MSVPTFDSMEARAVRLALFSATCFAAAVLVPAALAEDAPPGSGVTAGATAGVPDTEENHGHKVRACARTQKSEKKTGGGHGKRVRECAKKQRELRDEKKQRAQERRQQCRELREESHAAMDELKADFRARFEALKELPREEHQVAARALKEEYEQAKNALRDKVASAHAECRELKERAEEHKGEGKARP